MNKREEKPRTRGLTETWIVTEMDFTSPQAMHQARDDGQEDEAEAESLVAEVSEREPVTPGMNK